ncbi:MAG: hypothetical protein EA343_24285 [Nodularia sp. (in: Bacteria)]|nr:MAG: hypothetical protein EA343_24285 [Nodularia sp. (in: cyanobacteria)]
MTNNIKPKDSKLFIDLNAQQQEKVSGGSFDFMFFQQTNIESLASNYLNVSNGSLVASMNNQASYRFSQTTLILASFSGGLNNSRSSSSLGINLFNRFFR